MTYGGYDILHSAAFLCGPQFLLSRAISVCRRIFILLVVVQLYQTVLNELFTAHLALRVIEDAKSCQGNLNQIIMVS